MALDHSAPLEVLDALKVADVDDRIRQATESLYQALIGGTDSGISKSEVSRICARPRQRGVRVRRSVPVVIATGVAATGRREVLGLAVGDSEAGAFWTAFLRSLKARGLAGVQLVIADAHTGLRGAAQAVFTRGRDPALPGPLRAQRPGPGPKGSAEMVAAAIRTVFAQPKADMIRDQLEVIATMLGRQFPTVEQMLRDAAEDSLAFADFPAGHWKKISSTHTLGRLDRGVKRRTDVVAVFPNPAALLRLAGAVLVEAHDQWQVSDRRYLSEGSTALLTAPATETGKEVATRDLIPA